MIDWSARRSHSRFWGSFTAQSANSRARRSWYLSEFARLSEFHCETPYELKIRPLAGLLNVPCSQTAGSQAQLSSQGLERSQMMRRSNSVERFGTQASGQGSSGVLGINASC